MHRIWVIAADEYRTNVRRTGFIVLTLIVPVIGGIALLVSALAGGRVSQFFETQMAGEHKPIGVVDEYGAFTPILDDFTLEYRSYPSEEAARDAIMRKEIDTAMLIPSDYLESGVIRVFFNSSALNAFEAIDTTRTRAFLTAHLLHGKVDEKLYARLQNPFNLEPVNLSQPAGEGEQAPTITVFGGVISTLIPYFLGIFLVVAIFTSSGYLMQSVTEEKTSRVMEVILSSISAETMLAGKIIGMGALGLTQVIFWLLCAGSLTMGASGLPGLALPFLEQPISYVLILIYFLLGFMIYAVLMGVSGSLGTTQQEAQQISSLFSMLAAVPFFFAGFIIQNPNAALARALSYFPLTSPTMMLIRITLGKIPLLDVLLSIGITSVCIPLLLKAGAKVFRMGLLVYGKRPSMAVIWKAIRQA